MITGTAYDVHLVLNYREIQLNLFHKIGNDDKLAIITSFETVGKSLK